MRRALWPLALLVAAPAFAQPLAPSAAPAAASSAAPSAPAPTAPPARSADPHAGMSPHGTADPHQQQPRQKGYQPPADGGRVDAALPPGSMVIFIGDAFDKPVPNAEVDLLITRDSVTEGKSSDMKRGVTNDAGELRFDDLPYGSGYAYAVRTKRGPATFEVGPMGMTDRGGVRAFLHVFESTTDINEAMVIGRTTVEITFKEDVLVINCTINYFNRSPLAWIAEQEIILPTGFKALTVPDGMTPSLVPTERGALMKGTLPPGDVNMGFRYQVPLEKDGDQSLPIPFLPNMAQAMIGMEASKKMKLSASGFAEAQRIQDQAGRTWLVTQRQVTRDDRSLLSSPTVTITGIPTRSYGGWISVALALLAAGSAAWYVISRREAVTLPEDTARDLMEAKQALLVEFAALERARSRGEIGPKTYERVRRSMLDALARILQQLEGGKAAMPTSVLFSPAEPAPAPPEPEPSFSPLAEDEHAAAVRTPPKKPKVRRAR